MAVEDNRRRAQGEAMRARLFPEEAPQPEYLPGFGSLATDLVYGEIWSRPGLVLRDRMICTLAALGATERLPQLRRYTDAALTVGLEPRAILEILLQAGLYAGFPAAENTARVAAEVFAARGLALPEPAGPDAGFEELTAMGDAMLQRLHGARGRQGYAAPDNPVTGALYPLAVAYGYGVLWHRPGLEVRERALCAVAAFTALKLVDQVRKFGQSALNVDLDRTAVIEAVVQTAPYSGFPPALNALAALSEVLAETDT